MKSTWFKLFFYAVLVIAILGSIRWVATAVLRSYRRASQ